MAVDYTVIIQVRQWLGNKSKDLDLAIYGVVYEPGATFVGQSQSYEFKCPNVDTREEAVLQFETFAVRARNVLTINGIEIPGGITAGPRVHFGTIPGASGSKWKSHNLIVPVNILREDNVLFMDALGTFGVDDFIVDNMVIFYKTKEPEYGRKIAD